MLIGINRPPAATPASNDAVIFDADTSNFESAVIKASMDVPVLVDFWAPWCGPCKQLMPVLEAAVKSANGKVRMAKINIDQNPELAQALRVQSVPTVFAFFKGQPVTAFAGVRPQSEINMLIDQLAKMAGGENGIDIPVALEQAAQALAQNDYAVAHDLYADILGQEPEHAQAYAGLIRCFIATGRTEEAQQYLEHAFPAFKNSAHFESLRNALELASAQPAGNLGEFEARIAKDPNDHQARFDLAEGLFASGRKEEAISHMLEIVRRNRKWEEEKARQQLLKYFDAIGATDPLVQAGRRKLSSVLFS